jgi:hypothetical protein
MPERAWGGREIARPHSGQAAAYARGAGPGPRPRQHTLEVFSPGVGLWPVRCQAHIVPLPWGPYAKDWIVCNAD